MAPTHLRHHDIGEQQINGPAGPLAHEPLRIIAVGGFDNVVTEVAKNSHRNVTHSDFVFENQNRLGPGGQFSRPGFL